MLEGGVDPFRAVLAAFMEASEIGCSRSEEEGGCEEGGWEE